MKRKYPAYLAKELGQTLIVGIGKINIVLTEALGWSRKLIINMRAW